MNFEQVDPNNPFLYRVLGSEFGGPDDTEDNGETASGVPTTLDDGSINPEPYVAVPKKLTDSGAVKFGQKVRVKNPANGKTMVGIVRDNGPSAWTGRGIDLAPHLMKALGADTDEELLVDFSPEESGLDIAGPIDTQLGSKPAKQIENVFTPKDDGSLAGIGQFTPVGSGGDVMEGVIGDGSQYEPDQDILADANEDTSDSPQSGDDAPEFFPGSTDQELSAIGPPNSDGFTELSDGSLVNRSAGIVGFKIGDGVAYYDRDGKKIGFSKDAGEKSFSMQDPSTGFVRRYTMRNGELHMIPIAGEGVDIEANTTGEGALQGLTPEQTSTVKDMVEYKRPPLAISSRNPMALKLMARAHMFDPGYDEKKYEVRKFIQKEFSKTTPASPGGAVVSANTAIRHLGEAWDAFQKLDNKKFRGYNTITNMIKKQVNDPDLSDYQTAVHNLGPEVAKAFTGNAPQLDTINAQLDNLSDAKDHEAGFRTFMRTASMIYQRLDEVGSKWEEGFNERYPRLLHEPAKKYLKEWGLLSQEDTQAVEPASEPGQNVDYAGIRAEAEATIKNPKSPPDKIETAKKALSILEAMGQ